MRICYLSPGLKPCGGIRVLIEHCNRLADRGHDVFLLADDRPPTWIDVRAIIISPRRSAPPADLDVVVASSYQTVSLARRIRARRYFYFVQMMEHYFFARGSRQYIQAAKSYKLARDNGFRFVTIAKWLRAKLAEMKCESVIVPNGVNREHFYPEGQKQHAIIIEGDDRNYAKDVNGISWRVGQILRDEFGVELWGYAAYRHRHAGALDKFFVKPDTQTMRRIYARAKFLLKASRFEGRSLSPLEAMACGTPSVRAITQGDDDLVDGLNCLRTAYNHTDLLKAGRSLLSDSGKKKLKRLTKNALKYADEHLGWDSIIERLEAIYAGDS